MYARAVEEGAARLRALRHEEWEDLGLGAVAIALAVAATQVWPELALPLFVGGVAVGAKGVRAAWRRWDLVDRLADYVDAYVIPEVLAYASRHASMERRRTFASYLRSRLLTSDDANRGRGARPRGACDRARRRLARPRSCRRSRDDATSQRDREPASGSCCAGGGAALPSSADSFRLQASADSLRERQKPGCRRRPLAVELLPNQRDHVVGLGVAAEHRLLEDELTVQVHVEDPVRSGHDLDDADLLFPLLEQPRRQTGGVRERPSGDAVFDANVVAVGHERIVAQARIAA